MKTMKIAKTYYQVIAECGSRYSPTYHCTETSTFKTKREAKKYIRKLRKSGLLLTDLALRTTEFYKV